MSQPKVFLDTLLGGTVTVILSDNGSFNGTLVEWNTVGFVVIMTKGGQRFIPWTAVFSVDKNVV